MDKQTEEVKNKFIEEVGSYILSAVRDSKRRNILNGFILTETKTVETGSEFSFSPREINQILIEDYPSVFLKHYIDQNDVINFGFYGRGASHEEIAENILRQDGEDKWGLEVRQAALELKKIKAISSYERELEVLGSYSNEITKESVLNSPKSG